MSTNSRQAVVPGPAEHVFGVLAQPDWRPHWSPYVTGCQVVAGEGVGRQERLTANAQGYESVTDQTVVAYEPGRTIAWRLDATYVQGRHMQMPPATTTFTLQPDAGGGTLVTMTYDTGTGLPSNQGGFGQRLASMASGQAVADHYQVQLMEQALAQLQRIFAEQQQG